VSELRSHGDARRRMARLVTEVMSPFVLVVVVIFIVAVRSAGVVRGLALGLVAIFFAAGLPYALVLIGVRRGRLTDHHIALREQRPRMMAIALVSVAAGLLVLLWLDAPHRVVCAGGFDGCRACRGTGRHVVLEDLDPRRRGGRHRGKPGDSGQSVVVTPGAPGRPDWLGSGGDPRPHTCSGSGGRDGRRGRSGRRFVARDLSAASCCSLPERRRPVRSP